MTTPATIPADPTALLRDLDKHEAEGSLMDFVRQGWAAIEPGVPFVEGWTMEAICEHLEAVTRGEIRRLLINIPPGFSKSMIVNVFWPAWEWTQMERRHYRYISCAHEQGNSVRDLLRCRDLLNSEWYQGNWPFKWKSDQNAKTKYENDRTGWREASSVGAGLIGRRGDRLILDDPHSPRGTDSDADREDALRWFSETLPTRLNDVQRSAIVVIMQRLHEQDVSGLILSKDLGYDHLCIPMAYEFDHPHKSRTKLGWADPRTEDGELAWPERFPEESVDELKAAFRAKGGTYAEAGQLQQRPTPRGGGMFQRKDFQFVDRAPKYTKAVRGWDLAASKKKGADWTSSCKMARVDGDIYVLDVTRDRLTPRGVETEIQALAGSDGHSVEISIPQDPGQAGLAQKSALAAGLHGYDVRFSPETGSKEDRAKPLAAQCEAGNVYLVRAAWNDTFVSELCSFPMGEFDDQVDAASRAYSRLIQKRTRSLGGVPQVREVG